MKWIAGALAAYRCSLDEANYTLSTRCRDLRSVREIGFMV